MWPEAFTTSVRVQPTALNEQPDRGHSATLELIRLPDDSNRLMTPAEASWTRREADVVALASASIEASQHGVGRP